MHNLLIRYVFSVIDYNDKVYNAYILDHVQPQYFLYTAVMAKSINILFQVMYNIISHHNIINVFEILKPWLISYDQCWVP